MRFVDNVLLMIRCHALRSGTDPAGDGRGSGSAPGCVHPAFCVEIVTLILNQFSLPPRAISFRIGVALLLLGAALFAGIAAAVIGNGAHCPAFQHCDSPSNNHSPGCRGLQRPK